MRRTPTDCIDESIGFIRLGERWPQSREVDEQRSLVGILALSRRERERAWKKVWRVLRAQGLLLDTRNRWDRDPVCWSHIFRIWVLQAHDGGSHRWSHRAWNVYWSNLD